jgi:transcriptional regulator with XRE-family HTH domain
MVDRIGNVPLEIKPRSEFGRRILKRIQDLHLDVKQVAARIEVKYETMRKVVKGDRPPTQRQLRDLARELTLDLHELEVMIVVDKLRSEHPTVLLHVAGVAEPEIIAIAREWSLLSPEQKQHVRWLIEKFAAENTEHVPRAMERTPGEKPP